MHAGSTLVADLSGVPRPRASTRTMTADDGCVPAPKPGELVPRSDARNSGEPFVFLHSVLCPDDAVSQQRTGEPARPFRQTIAFGIGGSSQGSQMRARGPGNSTQVDEGKVHARTFLASKPPIWIVIVAVATCKGQ
jgi:hypothetical protein